MTTEKGAAVRWKSCGSEEDFASRLFTGAAASHSIYI